MQDIACGLSCYVTSNEMRFVDPALNFASTNYSLMCLILFHTNLTCNCRAPVRRQILIVFSITKDSDYSVLRNKGGEGEGLYNLNALRYRPRLKRMYPFSVVWQLLYRRMHTVIRKLFIFILFVRGSLKVSRNTR